jgi:hypothetical protein
MHGHHGDDTGWVADRRGDARMTRTPSPAPAVGDGGRITCVVARAMRQILLARARRGPTRPRGADATPRAIESHAAALDDAITRLARLDARAAAVVELRVLGGLSVEEIARALDIHPTRVRREWAHARAWLGANAVAPN